MEKKTDMTLEFSRSNPGMEVSRPLEDQTDRVPEFNHPPDERRAEFFCAADQEKEFCRQEESPLYPKRRERRRRGLLLQMACVALGVVLVTSSFGEDILGSDRFFSDPSSGVGETPSVPPPSDAPTDPPVSSDTPAQGGQEQLPSQEDQHPSSEGIAEPPSLYVVPHGEETPVFIVSGGQLTLEGLGISGLSYDPDSNTLILSNFWGETICANRMGEDFSIYLKGDSDVNAVYSYGDPDSANGSLTIEGDYRAELNINANQINPVGIHLFAGGGSSALRIEPGVDMAVSGSEAAILVSDTSAQAGIVTVPCTMISGEAVTLSSETAAETSRWTFADPAIPTIPMKRVTFKMAFSVEYLSIRNFSSPITVYQGFATNYLMNIYEFPGYTTIQNGTEFTVINRGSPDPIYIYFVQYTKHSEPYLVLWEENSDGDSSAVQEVDMQGKYYGVGITYLATDGTDLYWVREADINGAGLPVDAVKLYPGESVSYSLPHDGSDSIYRVYAEVYHPELDHRYWIYSTIRVME